jgi:signal transduction histidine kinase
MLYASKDARQTRQLVDNLSRNINASGGYDWVDLLDAMKQPHDDDNYVVSRAVVDLAIGSARVHQQLLQRITEIGFLHSAEPSTPTISAGQFAAWFERTRRNEVEPLLKEHGRELRVGNYEGCADETRIRWDGEAMADIVRELVINALKYSREGAPVGVEYQFETAGPHPFCAVRVRNQPRPSQARNADGQPIVGIPDEYSQRVFELFYTIDSFPTALEGEKWTDGTGLYFVRALAEKMGGWADTHSGVDYSEGDPQPQVVLEVRLPIAP